MRKASFKNHIPVLIASTGSSFEAEIAGIMPEMSPIAPDTEIPIIILVKDNTN